MRISGISFVEVTLSAAFMAVSEKLQNFPHFALLSAAKCKFDGYIPARLIFCKIYLHLLQGNLAFCADFSAKIAMLEIILAFSLLGAYIDSKGKNFLQIVK